MIHLSSSGPRTKFGDRTIRRPMPLAVHPFQLLWNLNNRSVGISLGSSRILSNLIAAFLHESYSGNPCQMRFHSFYTQSFNQPLGNILRIQIQSRCGCFPKFFPSPLTPSFTMPSLIPRTKQVAQDTTLQVS